MRGIVVVSAMVVIAVGLCVSRVFAAQVDIIESQSFNFTHVMDQNWANVATSMGHTATIRPQTDLDTGNFFPTCDLLIISSGEIPLTPLRQANIQLAMSMAIPVYIQCESNITLTTNQTWANIVNTMLGSFTWTGTTANTLSPMQVSGPLSMTPNTVSTFTGFTGGAVGNGSQEIETNLHFADREFGWYFYPRVGIWIIAAANTDQEWVRTFSSPQLMENYIDNLLNRNASFIQTRVWNPGPPIVIPANGGSFTVSTQSWNTNSIPMLFTAWTEVELPNGNIFGPLQVWPNLTLAAMTTSAVFPLWQNVPGFAPPGTYYYHTVLGTPPGIKSSLDAVRFVKL